MISDLRKSIDEILNGPRGSKWWVSWFAEADSTFNLMTPWWNVGTSRENKSIICAAIKASSLIEAKVVVENAHLKNPPLVWRFVDPKLDSWSPFSNKFIKKDWMIWS